jgi:hypothetical protein
MLDVSVKMSAANVIAHVIDGGDERQEWPGQRIWAARLISRVQAHTSAANVTR